MRTPKLLTEKQRDSLLQKHPDWKLTKQDTAATLTLAFDKHVEAMVYIVRLTVHAEVLQHHPDITFTYKKVKVTTTTHDAGGLTKKDTELMKRAEQLGSGGDN